MSKKTSPFQTRAYAKLNLALSVGAPIDAPGTSHHGYHPICSFMHAIDLFDEIEIERLGDAEPSRFDIKWIGEDGSVSPVKWEVEKDLVFRAHAALEEHVGVALPCVIRVLKSIPAGGGLGGGSSDAASVLVGLDQVFGLGVSELLMLAIKLGSDIGYFIDGSPPPRAAIVSGFGEHIERVDANHSGNEITLIIPPFGCSTGLVYGAFNKESPSAIDESRVRQLIPADTLDDSTLFNDLASSACAIAPELEDLISRLRETIGQAVHVTGSGSTLFVLGRVESHQVHEVATECRVVHTRLV